MTRTWQEVKDSVKAKGGLIEGSHEIMVNRDCVFPRGIGTVISPNTYRRSLTPKSHRKNVPAEVALPSLGKHKGHYAEAYIDYEWDGTALTYSKVAKELDDLRDYAKENHIPVVINHRKNSREFRSTRNV